MYITKMPVEEGHTSVVLTHLLCAHGGIIAACA